MFARAFGFGLGSLGLAYGCACVLPRIGSPWPLEWMEGASLQHALRLWHGQPLYAAPSGEFIPFIYPPLAYWPMAVSSALFGPSLWAARLPSILACLVALWALLRAGTWRSGEAAIGALAAGLYCFGYGYCGGFMDVARVDALFVAFVLLGAERLCAREGRSQLWAADVALQPGAAKPGDRPTAADGSLRPTAVDGGLQLGAASGSLPPTAASEHRLLMAAQQAVRRMGTDEAEPLRAASDARPLMAAGPAEVAGARPGWDEPLAAVIGGGGDTRPLDLKNDSGAARRDAVALLWFVLATATKQHGLLFLLAASAYLLLRFGRSRLRAVGGAWLLFALTGASLEYATGGWLSTYLISVPRRHGLQLPLLFSFFAVDLCVYLPVLTLLALIGLVRRAPRWQAVDALLFAGLLASALGRAHPGGDDNVRLPAYALLVLVAALEFGSCWLRWHSRAARAALSGGVILQVAILWQPPSLYAPTAATSRQFAQLRAGLARCAAGGSSVALDHSGLTARPFVHTQAWSDLVVNHDRLAAQANAAVLGALAADDAPVAIALSTTFPALQRLLDRRYELCTKLPPLRLPTGYAPGVTSVYRRKP